MSFNQPGATWQATENLLDSPLYDFVAVEPRDNEQFAWIGYVVANPDLHIKLAGYPGILAFAPWLGVTISLGEVRHVHNMTMAARGLLHATSSVKRLGDTNLSGSALPGFELIGLKWRIGAVAQRSRTSVDAVGDQYIQCPDIIAALLEYVPLVEVAAANAGDITQWMPECGWDDATVGW